MPVSAAPSGAPSRTSNASSHQLDSSLASLPSISDLGDEYLSDGRRLRSLASADDDGEEEQHQNGLTPDQSVPASPGERLASSLAADPPASNVGSCGEHVPPSRLASSVTFGPTTSKFLSPRWSDDDGEETLSPPVRQPIFRRQTTQTTSLLHGPTGDDAQQHAARANYGTLAPSHPSAAARSPSQASLSSGFASLRSPQVRRVRKTLAQTASFVGLRRARSYDEGLSTNAPELGVASNGTRHWTSSFASVDWVHDAIKDSSRAAKVRSLAKRNWRWKLFLLWDRLQGWLIVTIVGMLTALVAFAIVRGEGWLFDLKDGYCARPNGGWRLSRGFCCAGVESTLPEIASYSLAARTLFTSSAVSTRAAGEETCAEWRTWESVLGPLLESPEEGSWSRWIPLERYMVEYVVYCLVAVALATLSSWLTVTFTRSTDFETRRDVVVNDKDGSASLLDAKPRKVMYYAGGSGIPEIKTILSGFVMHGYLGGRTLAVKAIGLTLSVAAGLSLGKEGPMVHIASCIGNMVSRVFTKYETNESKRREILSAACAAGVAVAFGAPIGGVLFSLEEVSFYFPPKVLWRSFWCAMVAVTTLKALDPFGTGKIVLFQVSYDTDWRFPELFIFAFLGAVMGLYGACFARLNMLWSKHVRGGTWMKAYPILEVMLVTLVTAILSFINPYTHIGGGELVLLLFSECKPDAPSHLCVSHPSEIGGVMLAIAVAMVLKSALTVITFGIKLAAGVFVPTLAVGACFGRIVGLALQDLQSAKDGVFSTLGFHSSEIVPGVYALVGAAAALAGVTRTTVSLAVIVMELTGSLTYAVPVILAVLAAKTVADALEPKGIYDLVIELNQIPFLDAKETHRWGPLQVADVNDAHAPVLRCDRDNTVAALTSLAVGFNTTVGPDGGFPILEQAAGGLRLKGILALNELEHVLVDLQDRPEAVCSLRPHAHSRQSSTFYADLSPFAPELDLARPRDPLDLSAYMDKAPLTVQLHSPLELVQQLFVKLGVRSLVCVDDRGFYAGLISKARWLAFLDELDGHA